jgi:hypothetical protein
MEPTAIATLVLWLQLFIDLHQLEDPVQIAESLERTSLKPDFAFFDEAIELLEENELEELYLIGEFYIPEIEYEDLEHEVSHIFSFFAIYFFLSYFNFYFFFTNLFFLFRTIARVKRGLFYPYSGGQELLYDQNQLPSSKQLDVARWPDWNP